MAPGGYAWWYLDALSDDGRFGLTLIAFLGSVFSPYYAAARRRAPWGRAEPLQHNAVNVALYALHDGKRRWSMTERGRGALAREARVLRIGPSSLAWHGETLDIQLDEVTAPWPSRIRGSVRVHTQGWQAHPLVLDAQGQHRWSVLAPVARVEVALTSPALRWSGPAYMDRNWGGAPLERAFTRWDWSRAHLRDERTLVMYDVQRLQGSREVWSLCFDADGAVRAVESPVVAQLPGTAWRLPRSTRLEAALPGAVRTLEDGPFYARSLLGARWQGEPVVAMHESLCLRRFSSPWVQAMLPFRMPRRR